MISLVLQHLENLQIDLSAIDPAQRTDAADRVAAMASELRRAVVDAESMDEPAVRNAPDARPAGARNH